MLRLSNLPPGTTDQMIEEFVVKTWSKTEIVELMLNSVREVGLQCSQLGQAYKIEDAIEQVYDDLNEQGLIEHTP